MRQQFVYVFIFLLIHLAVYNQNLLAPPQMSVLEEHDLGTFFGSERYPGSFMPEYIDNREIPDISLYDILWKKVGYSELELYKWPASLMDNPGMDIGKIAEPADPGSYLDVSPDPVMHYIKPANGDFHSLMFVEDWEFNKENFTLKKRIRGVGPVLEKKVITPLGGDSGRTDRIILGLHPYPEKLERKYERGRFQKRLIPFRELVTEFRMVDEDWQGEIDLDEKGKYWDGPGAYFLKGNPTWTEYHSNLLVEEIFDRAMEEGRLIYDAETDDPVEIMDVYRSTHPGRSLNSEKDMDLMKLELGDRVYSMYFYEVWSIDPETMYIVKTVESVAPVYWKLQYNEDKDIIVDEKGNPKYLKIPLFRIELGD